MAPQPQEEEECHETELPFAKGGPIFVPALVGPLSSGPDFKASILGELHCLHSELLGTSCSDEDLSVDDLKVFSDEELFERALLENFEDSTTTSSDPPQNILQPLLQNSEENANNSLVVVCDDASGEKTIPIKTKKRGRRFDRDTRAAELEGNYLDKVKKLAQLKQQQDEDKLSARLHSFCGNAKPFEGGAGSTFDKIERMKSLRFVTKPIKVKKRISRGRIPIHYPEIIFCVEIYHKSNNGVKTQEFLVTGSQKLSELRDNIYCLTDNLMHKAGKHDPSSYFLVENTFYNDTRDPSAIDYSRSVIEWLENSEEEAKAKWEVIISGGALKKKQKELLGELDVSSLPMFTSMQMQKARFSDLRFRLGAGYLYVHQGNCKHSIVIRDMRLIHPEDSQNKADYPLLTFQLKPRQRKCSVCKLYQAAKMTVDDKWAPENPCYFCIKCYFLLHYKEDNSLLYPHTVYDYHHE